MGEFTWELVVCLKGGGYVYFGGPDEFIEDMTNRVIAGMKEFREKGERKFVFANSESRKTAGVDTSEVNGFFIRRYMPPSDRHVAAMEKLAAVAEKQLKDSDEWKEGDA